MVNWLLYNVPDPEKVITSFLPTHSCGDILWTSVKVLNNKFNENYLKKIFFLSFRILNCLENPTVLAIKVY